jgi:hypothetical protein
MAGYDIRCEDLARVFLSDEPWAGEPEVAALAQAIQTAVENWLEDETPERLP